MTGKYFGRIVYAGLLCFVALSLTTSAFGQGRGGGGGRGSAGGAGNAGGPPAGVGVDRGLGTASTRSNGRSDTGLGTASDRSNGRSDEGLNRARLASDNLNRADQDLRDHPGIANTLHVNANDLRAGYQAALAINPNLKFGQYVAATRLAQNLGTRFPNVTRDAILAGLASGDSLGKTLQNLGLSSQEANAAKKQAEREIKQGRR
ncbi:MAG TPA: hypothetical protein DCK93_18735 [Blastocatellia bacterium]|jgi:hypothetical protein|nr:hypothetical protein [Blastocatellia bacterium]HAF24909.1 hypothetical protein [Blastocatellia bacterium]